MSARASEIELSREDCAALDLALSAIQHGKPRVLGVTDNKKPIRVFTDGASDEQSCSVGVVAM
eukprot:3841824-Amphidinium_carterae.1